MAKIVECIPNFSAGRDMSVVDALVAEAKSVPGVMLLDHSSDASHNRSVFTLMGDPDGIAEAAFRLCRLAGERIDMTKHSGEHPRMGATDVIPFTPIRNTTMNDCVAISKEVARRIWDELQIPSILYEESAQTAGRKNLEDVRRGQFEGMAGKLRLAEWAPDFGTRNIHPTAGITAIGARTPLIAFNVNLNTPDIRIARDIAKAVRGSSGGYRYCKALGIVQGDRNIVQVSMNIVNYEGTPLYRVFEAIRFEAERWGVEIIGSEVIGLTPMKALADCTEYYLKMTGLEYGRQVLENHPL